ncbi:SYG1 [Candida theae]|uniref:SYG1 n=1 Tax=Candida theae TaxID=1198502 RepID=A0AAD5G0W9_9ASCO|nr:SYG1 [Candida theae]KAI5967398.1 SYG1 [Candida theae]
MKFAEALSDGLVTEWQDQYVDYKGGKKLIKKIRKLKDEYDQESTTVSADGNSENNGTNNDRMPLLNSNDLERHDESHSDNTPPVSSSSSRHETRKPSVFNYSLKSSKTDYFAERRKFQLWLDEELSKVDEFYSEKEQDVYERFLLLEDQLYQMREQKNQIQRQRRQHDGNVHGIASRGERVMPHRVNDLAFHTKFFISGLSRWDLPSLPSMAFVKKWKSKKKVKYEDDISLHVQDSVDLNYAENRVRNGLVELSDRATDQTSLDSESEVEDYLPAAQSGPQTDDQIRQTRRRDYTPKKQHFGVPYLYAKKQLKSALLEHYRALSILKSYRTMNRTAFRKITKKYDKSMHTNIMEPFMQRINTSSYFLTSDLLDKIINQVEELYIAFFDPESKDRKQSLEKLKTIAYTFNSTEIRQPQYYTEFFSSGIFLGFGIPLFTLGLYTALHKTTTGELPEGRYLLQVWGGFFILTLAFLLFGINMAVFDKFRINYKFIFEFDIASALNYKQFWLLPSFAFAFLSLLGWFSFNNFWPHKFPGRDWPWIFFGVMLVIFVWPTNALYGSGRRWLQFALWRLLLSGLYPVEFRDFFLGDIVCSLTYTMGNLPFFFCLFAHHWNGTLAGQPASANTCTSSRSRLMGFFSTLPSVWRLLQCIRRYMDTGDWFPHLANMMKYAVSAVYYMTLSIYRIERKERNRIVFILFASLNSIYTSIWDIVMDWSLLQTGSKHFLLRDYLFYKKPYYYYIAMVLDVILRFQWIFYAFFTHQIQQSAVTSFCVALAEILRRFIWIFFRMENEHCTNVILFRASKDTPLPYAVSAKVERAVKKLVESRYDDRKSSEEEGIAEENVGFTTGRSGSRGDDDGRGSVDLTRLSTRQSMPHLQQRKTYFKQITDRLNTAHIKDFQRRKTVTHLDEDSDDEEDDDDDASIAGKSSKPSRVSSIREE